jgi:plasmid segregation protein ParM
LNLQTVIALDIGHSAVKCFSHGDGRRERVFFPSVVTPAFAISEENAARSADRETIQIGNRSYFFGQTAVNQGGAEAESGMSEGWISSSTHTILLLGALKKLASKPIPVLTDDAFIVVGLPAKYFASQKVQYKQLISSYAPTAEVIVLPQPMGPYFALEFDEEGRENKRHDLSKQSWGIIEVGHFTTDFALLKRGEWIQRGSDSSDGAFRAVETLAAKLSERIGQSVTLLEAGQALVDSTFQVFREIIDISAEIELVKQSFSDDVISAAERILDKQARSLDGIIVAGGGASLVRERLRAKYRNTVDSPFDRFCVAEGFLRAGLAAARDALVRSTRASASAPAAAT